MSLSLATRYYFTLLFVSIGYSQNKEVSSVRDTETTSVKKSIFYDDKRQKSYSVEYSFQLPTATGNNFMGEALDGKNGYSLRFKLFLYKQFFVGYNQSGSNFDVTDTALVGNYSSTRANERFFYLGYELLPINKVRLGLYSSFGEKITFSNAIDNTDDNKDTGDLWAYGVYLDYEVIRNLSLFVEYSFRNVTTDIQAPTQLQTYFEKATYNTVNFGIRYAVGNEDVLSAVGILK